MELDLNQRQLPAAYICSTSNSMIGAIKVNNGLQPPPGVLHFPVTSLLRNVVYLPKHGSGFAPLYQHWTSRFVLRCSCPIAYSRFSYAMQRLKGMMSLIPFIPPTHFLHYISSHNMISAVLYQYRAVMYIRITMSTFNYKRNKHYT